MPRRASDASIVRAGSSLAGLPLASPVVRGGMPDNMPPPKYSKGLPASQSLPALSSPVVVLQQGIDSIWFNYYGTLREDVPPLLEWAKEDAQASPFHESQAPLPPFDGVTPLMQDKGAKGGWEWRLVSRDVTVLISKSVNRRRPTAQVRVSAECLWRMGRGGRVAAELAASYLLPLFDGLPVVQLSAVHLATDYQGHVPVRADFAGLVKRARYYRNHMVPDDGDSLEFYGLKEDYPSFAYGKATALRVSGYDKLAELGKSGKGWFLDLWARHEDYQPDIPTWRIEFQFGREVLRDRGVETIADLFAGMAGMWAYAVRWFSFRDVLPDKVNKSRDWPVSAWWQALSSWELSDAEPLPRVKQVRPGFQRLSAGAFGYLTSLTAITEAETLQDALDWLLAERGQREIDRAVAAKRQRYAGFTMGSA
jgi:hypothetical protein